MRITIHKKNLDMTPALEEYIHKKIILSTEKLLKRCQDADLPVLAIEVARTTNHHHKGVVFRAEANLSIGKTLLRAEAEDVDVRMCCDMVKAGLEREISGYKSRTASLTKRRARRDKELRFDPAARRMKNARTLHGGI